MFSLKVIYTLTENLGLGHVEAIGLTTSVDQVVSTWFVAIISVM